MKLVTLASLCSWLLNNAALFSCEDMVVCYQMNDPVRTIDCGSDAIIQTRSIIAAPFTNNLRKCDPTTIITNMATRKPEHRINVNASAGCHGSRRCDILASATEIHINGPLYTNVLHVNYDCFQINKTSVARLPLNQNVTARNLHIFSPGYPDPMPKGTYSFQCVVAPVRTATHLNIMIERLKIFTSGQCFEQLRLSGTTPFCSSDVYQREIIYENGMLTINYERVEEGQLREGGYFWLHITGFQGDEPVDLKITCPDQSTVPGYSTTPLPSTTVTATVTATSVVTTTTTKFEGSDSGLAGDLGDEKALGKEMLAVLITLLIFILIVGMVILFLILKIRKRRKQKRKQSVTENLPGTVNEGNVAVMVAKGRISSNYSASVYSVVYEEDDSKLSDVQKSTTKAEDRKKDLRNKVYEAVEKNVDLTYAVVDKEKQKGFRKNGENKESNVTATYAVVDKEKGLKIDQIDNDEVVIFENNDLYAQGAKRGSENLENEEGEDNEGDDMYAVVGKDKTKTIQNTDTDETVICENDDLFHKNISNETEDNYDDGTN